jgi:hypothetical protein
MSSTLYAVIDLTVVEQCSVVTVAPLLEAQAIGKLQKAKGREVIGPPLEGRGLAKLEKLTLQYLYWNTTQTTPPDDYAELVQAMLAVLNVFPLNDTPLAQLEAEVALLAPEPEPDAAKRGPKIQVRHVDPALYKADAKSTTNPPPKSTSTTGLVWILADAELSKLGMASIPGDFDWKPLRASIVAACDREGINHSTAGTQYSKWKASKLSPAAA